ncbi:MAG: hypothetical protein ACKVHE_34565, partial [Planctomycetales bacterium]
RYTVQQIKLFCPGIGKVKIAETLARAGVHLGKTTVERILQEKPIKAPESTLNGKTSLVSRSCSAAEATANRNRQMIVIDVITEWLRSSVSVHFIYYLARFLSSLSWLGCDFDH